jgi:OOP family OmpA-OmpF porin
MGKSKRKNLAVAMAALGLVAGMSIATQAMAEGERHYAVDGSGGVVKNTGGNCWRAAGGRPSPLEACGDEMPVEEVVVEEVVVVVLDSDGDGVNDDIDKCPGTRAGAAVDQWGCEVVANLTIDLVEGEFAFDSAVLTPAMKAALDDLANQIKESKGHEVVTIIGHTDSTGPEGYNLKLSERRAQAAADHLEAQGIDSITVIGKGELEPVADNSTRDGRAMNRRIEVTTH